MARGRGVPLLDGQHGGTNKSLENIFDFVVEQCVFHGNPGLRGQGFHKHLCAGVHGDDQLIDVIAVSQGASRVALFVDQLDHAEYSAREVDHRYGQDGAGVVARLLVPTAVVVIGRVGRDVSHVGNVDGLAQDGSSARDGLGRDGEGELL